MYLEHALSRRLQQRMAMIARHEQEDGGVARTRKERHGLRETTTFLLGRRQGPLTWSR